MSLTPGAGAVVPKSVSVAGVCALATTPIKIIAITTQSHAGRLQLIPAARRTTFAARKILSSFIGKDLDFLMLEQKSSYYKPHFRPALGRRKIALAFAQSIDLFFTHENKF
jgi:hypothetical protein